MLNIDHYFDAPTWIKLKDFAKTQETPFVMINLDSIKKKYQKLTKYFPMAKIYYAVKANPAIEIIRLLHELGSCFDIASIYELEKVLSVGTHPDRISFGNTIKKIKDIRNFYEKGIRLFATDSEEDLRNIAQEAPGSKVYVRILMTEGSETSDWSLSRKFGCHPEMATELLILAQELGLNPYGVSFHVGSQQRDIGVWDSALSKVEFMFHRLSQEGINLKMINLGGGFPAHYLQKTHKVSTYAKEILKFLRDDFGDKLPEIILEPGRSLVAESGIIVTEVILVSRKAHNDFYRWVYTDIGKFSGMIETLEEAIRYPLHCDKTGESEEVIIAGPTCDSMDILYEHNRYALPLNLQPGDRLYWFATGAYTTSYSSVEFNGFPPLKAYYL
jgi:ornithine decarboxylase